MKNQKAQKQQIRSSKNLDPGKIDFVGKTKFFVGISVVLTILAVISLVTKGLKYGIDFAGGIEIQVKFASVVSPDEIRNLTTKIGVKDASIQGFGEGNEYLLKLETLKTRSEKEINQSNQILIKNVTEGLKTEFAAKNPEIRRVDSVGPQVGKELKRNGLLAAFYSLLVILIYVGLRFDYKYAPGAVICLIHDTFITLGIFSFFDKQITVPVMAAILTLIGYSLNDTIICYDRIRENEDVYRGESTSFIINRSINDVFTRSLLTSLTAMLATLSLYFFGGGIIEDLAFALVVGIIIGTYSSIYVASPLILIIDKFNTKHAA